ncbi:hypothetical protein COM54_24830, partial [Bacillus toyonensis]
FLNQFGIYVPSPFTHYILSRINGQVRPPPQNSVTAKKLGGDQLPVKARLVKANNQWGMKKTPTDY